jgi:hypothetical protein
MNVRLPDGLPSGDKLELVLRFECGEGKTCDSRPGVTLAVQ